MKKMRRKSSPQGSDHGWALKSYFSCLVLVKGPALSLPSLPLVVSWVFGLLGPPVSLCLSLTEETDKDKVIPLPSVSPDLSSFLLCRKRWRHLVFHWKEDRSVYSSPLISPFPPANHCLQESLKSFPFCLSWEHWAFKPSLLPSSSPFKQLSPSPSTITTSYRP